MSTLLKAWLLILFCAGCDSRSLSLDDLGNPGSGDLATPAGSDGGGDLSQPSDGAIPSCSDISPSGYECDPWSTHLYVLGSAQRNGASARLHLFHNPDYEGRIDDMTIPPEHDYYQELTVDVALNDAVKQFLCVVFNPQTTPASFDASSPSFSSSVTPAQNGLSNAPGGQSTINLIDFCGSPTLASVYAPTIAPTRPNLPDVALTIPLEPKPRDFTVGQTFQAWVARGILYVDEQGELSPAITATVVAVQ